MRRFLYTLIAFLGFHVGALADSLPVAKIIAGDDGVTRYADVSFKWSPFASDGRAAFVTPLMEAEQVGYLRLEKGFDAGFHPAPKKQYVMVMQGVMEVETGDGEKRQFTPGTVLFVTDTTDPGHKTRVVGDEDVVLVWVPVP